MAEILVEELNRYRQDRILVNPYQEWCDDEGVPVIEDFGVDLLATETRPWDRFGCNGAIVNLKGRGSFCSTFLYEIPAGGASLRQRHLYEDVYYVLSGHGSAQVEASDGRIHSFEWGPRSLFALPINAPYRLFNASGRNPARLVSTNTAPTVINLYRNIDFIFDNQEWFDERESDESRFMGEGEMTAIRPGRVLWDTNFVPDLSTFELHPWEARGAGSANMQFILADGVLGAHVSEMPVGTYKKGHRHGPGLHIFIVSGQGYSLLWYEGDKEFVRVNWRHGMLFAPPNNMFHQHFDTSRDAARYLAVGMGSKRYPVIQVRKAGSEGNRSDVSIKKGGRQIEYEDQDERIHKLWLEEIRKTGVESKMGKYIDESRI